jgi:hypothetical protein
VTRRQQDLLSSASIATFKLNGQFLALAEELARPAGLTAVLGEEALAGAVATLRALSAALAEIQPAG